MLRLSLLTIPKPSIRSLGCHPLQGWWDRRWETHPRSAVRKFQDLQREKWKHENVRNAQDMIINPCLNRGKSRLTVVCLKFISYQTVTEANRSDYRSEEDDVSTLCSTADFLFRFQRPKKPFRENLLTVTFNTRSVGIKLCLKENRKKHVQNQNFNSEISTLLSFSSSLIVCQQMNT